MPIRRTDIPELCWEHCFDNEDTAADSHALPQERLPAAIQRTPEAHQEDRGGGERDRIPDGPPVSPPGPGTGKESIARTLHIRNDSDLAAGRVRYNLSSVVAISR